MQPAPTKSPRARRPAPRVSPKSFRRVCAEGGNTSLYIPRPLRGKKRNRGQKILSKNFPHGLQAPVNGDLHRPAAHSLGPGDLINGQAQQVVGVDAPPLGRYEAYPKKDCALLMTAADDLFWTFEQAVSYYQFALVNYIGFHDKGMLLAGGCGDTNGKPQIEKTSHLQEAYEFGKRLYRKSNEEAGTL